MHLLIDAQILTWIHENNSSISKAARTTLMNSGNKVSIEELIAQITKDGIYIITLDNRHISSYDQIPLYPDHRDPFDRLILATALVEKIAHYLRR